MAIVEAHAAPMRSAAVTQARSRKFPRDVVIALALAAAGGATLASLPANAFHPLAAVMVGLVAGGFVMVLDSAAWVVAPLLVVEFSLRNYQFGSTASTAAAAATVATTANSVATAAADPSSTGGVTLRLIAVLLALVLNAPVLQRVLPRVLRSRAGLRVVLPAVLLIMLATSFDLLREDPDLVGKYLRYQLTGLAVLLLVACMVRQPRHVRLVLLTGFGLTLASSALAVYQLLDPVNAPVIGLLGNGNAPVAPDNPASLGDRALRAVGLTNTPIQLAGLTSVVLPVLLGVLVCGGIRSWPVKYGLLIAACLIGAATYLTFTRSAILAIAAGIACMAVFLPAEQRLRIWTALIAAGVAFLLLEGSGVIGQRYYQGVTEDASAATHLALLQIGLAIALDNPVNGIGHGQFQEVSTGYAGVVSTDARAGGGTGMLGTNPPHDDFLLVWISWGLPALAAYIWLLLGAVRNCVHAATHAINPLVRGTAIGTLGGLVSYIVNSSLHNYLDTSLMLWLCAGMSVALARAALRLPARYQRARPVSWTSAVEVRRIGRRAPEVAASAR